MSVTVVIATIPPRREMLKRAVASVRRQTVECNLAIAEDTDGDGGAATRNRAQESVRTEWLAYLDDDDELLPHHVEHLLRHAALTGADLVYPLYEGRDNITPEGPEGDIEYHVRHINSMIPVTVLVRRELVEQVGGFPVEQTPDGEGVCYEWGLWIRLLDAGAKFAHLPEVTWRFNLHKTNTGGGPWR